MYTGGTIFYDHASKLIHISNQVTLIASDTVHGKLDFERVAAGHGVTIEQYHCDNGVFKSQLWSDSCEEAGQLSTSMSGVGAHHQNAAAEQSIGTVVRSARTMLLHATIYGPKDGKKLPKWSPQKQCGQFLGWSKSHASSVALARNLNTGSITPQFHTVMDDWFTTIARMGTDEDFTPPDGWKDLFKFNRINLLIDWDPAVDGNLLDLAIEWLSEAEVQARERQQRLVGCVFDPPPWIDPESTGIDNAGNEIPHIMPAPEGEPEGGNNSLSTEDNDTGMTQTERRYPIYSTCGIQPRELDDFQMMAHLAYVNSADKQ
eukprot:2549015-Ditylum_brightwellii.AAC.1